MNFSSAVLHCMWDGHCLMWLARNLILLISQKTAILKNIDLASLLNSESDDYIKLRRMVRYLTSVVRGSSGSKQRARKNLLFMMRELGCPSHFVTFSSAHKNARKLVARGSHIL